MRFLAQTYFLWIPAGHLPDLWRAVTIIEGMGWV